MLFPLICHTNDLHYSLCVEAVVVVKNYTHGYSTLNNGAITKS